jgi:alpha-L-arabinofuranosidase
VVLAGDAPEAYNDADRPHRVEPLRTRLALARGAVTLPPHSLTIVKLKTR